MATVRRKYGRILTVVLLLLWGWVGTAAGQTGSGIGQPASGETVAGIVEVRGTAVHPDFLRYELAFAQAGSSEWIVFAEGDQPVIGGVLAVWDTTVGGEIGAPVFPDGGYQLRLRVVKTDYNYDEFFVTNVIISNLTETPTPTPDETAVAATETAVFAGVPVES
ncbi:MAG: hypothetical protein KC419_22015, partial [Anaerolineales bacterium]|nr:hypothetical protein [Anaerolineales bacterium]